MPSPQVISGAPEQGGGAAPKPGKVYSAGTLRYDQRQLFVLFFWLMWNDFSISLIEQIAGLTSILMRNHGATFTQMAFLGSFGAAVSPWINPWVSTWSDRHRGPHGRRRPFLFVATPLFAAFLIAVPYMPDFYRWLLRVHFADGLLHHLPMNGEAMFIGVCGLVYGLFNAAVLAIFSYLYWDVVPAPLMGRFQSMTKNVALIAGLVWSFFIYGQGDIHPKTVYAGTGIFCLIIYLVSVWQIKEGEYPPPDPHKIGGRIAPIRAYFIECYSEPYFLWVFLGMFLYQLGNSGGAYQLFYVYSDLKLPLASIGWANGWGQSVTTGFGLLCGFAIGSLTDRLKPVRLIGPCYIVAALVTLIAYFIVHDRWTLMLSGCMRNVVSFVTAVVGAAFTVEIFPREKLGQFCSAQALFYQLPVNFAGIPIAMLFDHLKNNRLGYVWSAFFYLLAGLTYVKVYFNWKKRHGQTPVPHAG